MKRRGLRYWLAYCLGVTAFVLVGLEVAIRLLVPESRFWVVSNIYRASPDAAIGYTLLPNQQRTAFGVDLVTNSHGFRGDEWSPAKPPGVFRIALVGDSHAFGFGVPSESTMGECLRRELNARGRRAEVLNFSAPGYNSRQEAALFSREVLKFSPDAVVLVPSNNDDDDALTVDSDGYLVKAAEQLRFRVLDGTAPKMQPPATVWRRSRLYLYVRMLLAKRRIAAAAQVQRPPIDGAGWMGPIPAGDIPERLQERVARPLSELIHVARAHGIKVVLAPVAAPLQWRRLFAKLATDESVPELELLSLFSDTKSWEDLQAQFGLGWDPHLNKLAHARFGAALAAELSRQEGRR